MLVMQSTRRLPRVACAMLMTPPSRRTRQRGVTVIELLVGLALLAIVSGIAAPGLSSFSNGQRAKAVAFDITSDLMVARSEALKRNAAVTVAPITAGDWTSGWQVTSGTEILLSRSASTTQVSLTNAPASINFNAQGRVTSPTQAVRITVGGTGVATNAERCVELDISGRARTKSVACT